MFIDPKFYNVSTNNWYAVVVFFFAATPNEPNSVNFMLLVLYQTTERKKNLNKFIVHMWFFTQPPKKLCLTPSLIQKILQYYCFTFRHWVPAHAHDIDCIYYVWKSDGLQSLFLSESLTLFSYPHATNQAGKQAYNIQWGGSSNI